MATGRMGVIIAPKLDVHAFAVQHAAKKLGSSVTVIDTADFTQQFGLAATWNSTHTGGWLFSRDKECIDLSDLTGLWWRRPRNPAVSELVEPDFSNVAVTESKEAIFGSLNALVKLTFNDTAKSRAASQKALQLTVAKNVGLTIPDTLITNDPNRAREFYDIHSGRIIYKVFRGPEFGFYPTRMVTPDDLRDLASLRNCPCIFQEYIDGEFDVRVTVVGDHVFTARIDYDKSSKLIDTRATSTECKYFELPSDISRRLLDMLRHFGLIYGAVDMRFSSRAGFVFFELNPEGQYLWTEIEANLPISETIALLLTKG